MKTLKELTDLGAAAAFANNKYHHYMSVSRQSHSWESDEPARQAFAAAVRDAVLAELATKSDSSPTTKTIPLDMGDIRATDEFTLIADGFRTIRTPQSWGDLGLSFSHTCSLNYESLASKYLRRQHGSTEWKPCTKEITA
jgi:hypothetical protein